MRIFSLILGLLIAKSCLHAQNQVAFTAPKGAASEQFKHGYIDAFSINNIRFRVKYSKEIPGKYEPHQLLLQQYKKRWITIDNFSARGMHYWTADINNDGYPDFVADNRWQMLVYMFNPKQHTFTKCGYFADSDDDTLHPVSLKDNLYFDKWSSKWDNWWSYLYVLKNYVRYNVGIIEYKYTQGYDQHREGKKINEYISIRKIAGDTEEKEIAKIKAANFAGFDIKGFWLKEKNRFYPNNLMKPNYTYTKIYEPGE